jgi:hypothetical protein
VGFAARRYGSGGILLAWVIGLLPAMFLHGLWNVAGFFVDDFLGYYVAVQVPLFLIAVAAVVLLRRHEIAIIRRRLQEYTAAGWFLPGEVAWLATSAGRRAARRWARSRSRAAGESMKRFTADATALAFTRERMVSGRAGIGSTADEAALLQSVTAERANLLA